MPALEHLPGDPRRWGVPSSSDALGWSGRGPLRVPLNGGERHVLSGRSGTPVEAVATASAGNARDLRAECSRVAATRTRRRLVLYEGHAVRTTWRSKKLALKQKGMSADALVCAVCGSSGFLADKVPLLPFLIGILLGTSLPSRISDRIGFQGLMANAFPADLPEEIETTHED